MYKNIDLLCWVYIKINSFLSFQSPIFHSKIHKCRVEGGRRVHIKQTGMSKGGEGVKNWKFQANVLFEWPQKTHNGSSSS